jgi:glycosyltransferase involved in cell wall biosynthesis
MSQRTVLSIALCTYNGERFLPAQLDSFCSQQRLPDELIVCDDASRDGTVRVVQSFAERAPFPVRLEVNPTNLGTAANFTKALSLVRGDLILPADQDDVWCPEKLDRIERTMAENPAAGVAFSNATLVDENLHPRGSRLWNAIEFGSSERRLLATGSGVRVLARRNVVTGAAMAFRSAFRDLVLPVPSGWVHDAWIALLIAAVAPIVPIPESLILYRQHPDQQIGAPVRGLVTQYQTARERDRAAFRGVAERFAEALDRLSRWPRVPPESLRVLTEKVRHAQIRARMREPGVWRLPSVLRECWRGNYRRYSRGWKAVAQDLFLP